MTTDWPERLLTFEQQRDEAAGTGHLGQQVESDTVRVVVAAAVRTGRC